MLLAQPEPSYIMVELDTKTEVLIFLGGTEIQSGKLYEVSSPTNKVELKVVFVDGDRVKTLRSVITLHPGATARLKIVIDADPPLVLNA